VPWAVEVSVQGHAVLKRCMTEIALPGGNVCVPSAVGDAVGYIAILNHAGGVDENTVAVKRNGALVQIASSHAGNAGATFEMLYQRSGVYENLLHPRSRCGHVMSLTK